MKILIVEDDALVATAIENILAHAGFQIVGIAGSGAQALALAQETRPALALVDVRITGELDGIEVACLLRQSLSVPSIILTGMDEPETLRRALVAQPLCVLQKPFRPSQVYEAIQQALRTFAANT